MTTALGSRICWRWPTAREWSWTTGTCSDHGRPGCSGPGPGRGRGRLRAGNPDRPWQRHPTERGGDPPDRDPRAAGHWRTRITSICDGIGGAVAGNPGDP